MAIEIIAEAATSISSACERVSRSVWNDPDGVDDPVAGIAAMSSTSLCGADKTTGKTGVSPAAHLLGTS
jgi:hypothetical protein